jgi:ATP-dependent protease ClpP protease subunit
MIAYTENCSEIRKLISVKVQRFTEDSVEKLEKAISEAHQVNQPILPITIESNGGCAYALIAMSEIIKSSKIIVATIVESRAMSCGAVLFTMGHQGYRYMGQNAVVMMHDVKTNNSGRVEDVKADAKESERLNDILYEMMATNCGHQKDFFKKMAHDNSHADLYFNSQECLKHNITNHIKIPTFKIKISMEYTLC